jgi:7-cyano-7-deazaguanine synthase in queuosine biosynthesis
MNINIRPHLTERKPDGLARVFVEVPDLGVETELDIGATDLLGRCGVPDPVALDFLLIASSCYVIDKIISRADTFDNWTRDFEVSIPVSAPRVWKSVADDLQTALGFLTGDVWKLAFHALDVELIQKPEESSRRRASDLPPVTEAAAVSLFSGGLDSLCGVIDLLAAADQRRVLLVGHYDAPGPRKSQNDLFTLIGSSYPQRAELLQTRVAHKPRRAVENTLRSRSLVFIALGIYAARAAGETVPLYAPENGLIAINIPLTPSRSGSCSTRTMHPYFLGKLATVLQRVGIKNQIINPFQLKTKGECVTECLDQKLLRSVVEISVSCSHASRRQNWVRREAKNCGYCVPCLIRRSALHKAGLDHGRSYGIDVCRGEMSIDDQLTSADDLRALVDFLRDNKTASELARDVLRTAPVEQVMEVAGMLERGFNEIRTLFRDKGDRALRQVIKVSSVE